jgi:hypothetical protein
MTQETQPDSAFGCLLQLVWTLAGPGLLLAAGALLVVNHPPLGSAADCVFLGLAVLVGSARALDRKPGASRLKYLAVLAAGVALTLVVAHLVAPRFA